MVSRVRKFRIMFLTILLCISYLSQITVHVLATKGSYPGGNGMIAFTDWVEGGDLEIFVMNRDGTGVRRLTFNETHDTDPCWSPDGQWIVFVNSDGGQRWDVWVINVNGTGLRRVTTPPDNNGDFTPAWSPDGKTIIFRRFTYGITNASIYKIDADSTGVGVKLIEGADEPCYSPDGSMIAYVNRTDSRIWVADSSTGAPLFRVTLDEGEHPCWSPDGQRIVYEKGDESGEIWVINVDGSNDQQVTNPPHEKEDRNPNWSPDGKKIIFDREGDSIWIVNPDGSNIYDLTPTMPEAHMPDWQTTPPIEPPVGGEIAPMNAILPTQILTAILIAMASAIIILKKNKIH